MGKSLHRICKACKVTIKSDFNKHATKVCKKKQGFKGWIFLNREGKQVSEDHLPMRLTRITNCKPGRQIGSHAGPAKNLEAAAWRKIKRGSVFSTYSVDIRKRAFMHFARCLMLDKRFPKKVLL